MNLRVHLAELDFAVNFSTHSQYLVGTSDGLFDDVMPKFLPLLSTLNAQDDLIVELSDEKRVTSPTLLANLEDLLDPDIKRVSSGSLTEGGETVFLGLEVVPDIVDRVQLPFNAKAFLDLGILCDSVDAPVQSPIRIE